MEFPNTFVDRHFAHLLGRELHSSERTDRWIAQYIVRHRGFHRMILYCFEDVGDRIESILSALGWTNFRDRLAGIFLHYAREREFPRRSDFQEARHLVEFEGRVTAYTTSGHSRAFLLALYLELAGLRVPEGALALLDKGRAKVVRIDWAILLFWHFLEYLGEEELGRLLDQRKGLGTLQDTLKEEQRDQLYGNLLLYSYGIDDQDFFQAGVF